MSLKRYYCVYKPFQVLSQFTSPPGKKSLSDFFDVPKDVYPTGRLDYDSEGLLILTNDSNLNHRLLNPAFGHEREYWVQVDGSISSEAIGKLCNGVRITVENKPYLTKKSIAEPFTNTPAVPERNPPIRFRKNIPATWIRLILSEGKNRQVRKMTAAVGYPTLRLIRYRINSISIKDLKPGDMQVFSQDEIFKLLF